MVVDIEKQFEEDVKGSRGEPDNITIDEGYATDENGVTPEYSLEMGIVDENGITHNTYTLREINGKDEEAISKNDIKNNIGKVLNTLLSRCCLSIGTLTKKDLGPKKWENLIKSLSVGDQDIMFLRLRKISLGSEMETTHECPSCGAALTTLYDTDELEIVPFNGKREIPFDLPRGYKDAKGEVHKLGVMRYANGLDREILAPLLVKNVGKARTSLLKRTCTFNSGIPITDDIMSSLSLKDRDYLQKLSQDNLFGVNMEIEVSCTDCGEDFKGKLNPVNFL